MPNTPFNADGEIDIPGIKRLTNYLAAAEIPAALVLGVAAEAAFLTPSEKTRLTDAFVGGTAGRFDLIVSVSGETRRERVAEARAARRAGAVAANLRRPNKMSGTVLLDAIAEVAAEGPSIIMLQDFDLAGPGILDEDILRAIDEISALESIKIETQNSLEKITRLRRAEPRPIHYAAGWPISAFLESFERGADAVMPTSLTPCLQRLYCILVSGRSFEARRHFNALLPLFDFMTQSLGTSIAVNKMLRVAEGVFDTEVCRHPEAWLSEDQRHCAVELIGRALSLQNEVLDMGTQI